MLKEVKNVNENFSLPPLSHGAIEEEKIAVKKKFLVKICEKIDNIWRGLLENSQIYLDILKVGQNECKNNSLPSYFFCLPRQILVSGRSSHFITL